MESDIWFGNWRLMVYPGNPLGHEYGQPFKQLTLHPEKKFNCTDRITDYTPAFDVKLAELRAEYGEGSPMFLDSGPIYYVA